MLTLHYLFLKYEGRGLSDLPSNWKGILKKISVLSGYICVYTMDNKF